MNIPYDTILDALNDIVWSCSASDFSVYYMNKACEKVYGYLPEDFYKDKQLWFRLLLPEDKEVVAEQLQKLLVVGKNKMKYRIRHRDGSIRYIYDKAKVIYDEDGNAKTINGTAVDITTLYKARCKNKISKKQIFLRNQEIKHQQQNLLGLINNTTDAIWSVSKHYTLITANNVFIEAMRLFIPNIKEGDNLLLKEFGEDNMATWKNCYDRVLAGETLSFEEVTDYLGIGKNIYTETNLSPIKDENGNITGISCFRREVTARRSIEEKLKRQNEEYLMLNEEFRVINEELKVANDNFQEINNRLKERELFIETQKAQLQALIDNTQDLIWSINKDFQIEIQNVAYAEFLKIITGVASKEEESVFIDELGEDVKMEWFRYYQRGLSGEMFQIEKYLRLPHNQGDSYAEITFNPIKNKDRDVIGVGCFARNITEKKNAEEKLRKQSEELKRQQQNLFGLINNTSDSIWSVSKNYTLITANDVFRDTIQLFTHAPLREGDNLLFKEFGAIKLAEWKNCYDRVLAGETLFLEDMTEYQASGKIYTETNLCPIRDENEHITGISCFARNVTVRKNIEEKLRSQREEYLTLAEEYKSINEELQEKNNALRL
jgi:PAS domain S-box-containing protein